jgi:electron transfer flavoprotein-quinone oxidoreductase
MSLYKEGTNHAMESGRCAGETAIEARRIQNYSRSALRRYEERLRKGNAMKDMKKYRRVPFVLAHTPDLFNLYPKKAANLLVDYFSVLDESKSKIQRDAVLRFLKGLPKFRFVRDMIRAKNMC